MFPWPRGLQEGCSGDPGAGRYGSFLQVKTRSSTQCDILKNELCSEEKKVRFTRNDSWSVFGEKWVFLDIGGHQTLERDWRNHLVEKLCIDNEGHHCLEALNQITDLTVHKGYWPGIQLCKCTKCGKAYRGCSFQNQQRSLPGYTHYPCEECGETCSCVSCLSPPRGTDIVEEPNKCQDAGRTCKRCVKSHGSKRSSDCKKSGKALAFHSSFKGHERGQHGQKIHMYKVCGKSFTYHSYLAQHMRTHTGEKHCECEECEQALRYSSSLVGHMTILTSDKPYVCKNVGKPSVVPNTSEDT
uniref:C2H2-type domain-containing protein n=1 Tax=Moschus moschiferus TaxID=68415 RepID=A0A8C6CJE5_MOSMO